MKNLSLKNKIRRCGTLIFCLKIGWFIGILLVLFISPLRADEVFMANGDRLQGTVVAMHLGKLDFRTAYAGTITIDWEQVVRLMTDGTLEVTLDDETTLIGHAVVAEKGTLVLQPERGSSPATIPLDQIAGLGEAP